MYDLAIINGDLYIEGKYVKKNLYIKDGTIAAITKSLLKSETVYDAAQKKVLPGFIDPHVHFELDIGRYRSSDDFYTGSISAAYGGVTTIIDFLNPISKGCELEEALNHHRKIASKSVIDYAFHATIKNPINEVKNIVNEMNRLQIPSVKLFTTYSDSNRRTYDNEIIELLSLSKEKDILVLAHIEADDLIKINPDYKVSDLPTSRGSYSEVKEALKLAKYTKECNGNLYMVHLSSGYTLKALIDNYNDILNKNFIIESCPHYFVFDSSVYEKDKGYLYTMAPPLRTYEENEVLKEYSDYIHTIGTDHCPFRHFEKDKASLLDVPLGIGGIEHSFNIMYILFKDKAIDKMTVNVAKTHNLYPKKGILQVGSDADIVIYDDGEKHIIDTNHSKCNYNLYEGFKVLGKVESTISRGNFIIKKGVFLGGKGKYARGDK